MNSDRTAEIPTSTLQLLAILPQPAMLAAADGSIVAVNTAWRRKTGLQGEEYRGKSAAAVMSESVDWNEELRAAALGRGRRLEFGCTGPDGRDISLACRVIPLECGSPGQLPLPALIVCDQEDVCAPPAYGPAQPSPQSTEERYGVLFENAPLGVFTSTAKGRFINVNKTLAMMLGYGSPEEVLENVTDIAKDLYVQPERREEIVRLIKSNPGLARFENRYRRRDGSEFIGSLHVSVLQDPDTGEDYLLGMVEDITERMRAEEALRESEDKFHSIFRYAPVGIYQSLLEGRYLSVNPEFAAMHGYASPTAVMDEVRDIGAVLYVDPRQREHMLERLLAEGQVHNFEVHSRRKDGSTFWSSRNVRLMRDGQNRPLHIKGFITDISKQKELEQLREDVERITRHDLKSPLMSLILGMRLLQKDDNVTDHQKELLRELELTGSRMLDMINLSLDLYKMETGSYTFEPEPLDLLQLLRGVSNNVLNNQRRKQLRVSIEVEGETPGPEASFMLEGEELLCYSMFVNLLQNAVEASPPECEVRVSLARNGKWAEISIHNQGAVPEHIRPVFFKKYSTFGKSGGTGLGTYSARRIAQTHGGDITFSTSEAQGTTVTVRLPLHHDAVRDSAASL